MAAWTELFGIFGGSLGKAAWLLGEGAWPAQLARALSISDQQAERAYALFWGAPFQYGEHRAYCR